MNADQTSGLATKQRIEADAALPSQQLFNESVGLPSDDQTARMFECIEAMFFAYREFIADADRLLQVYHFGRAHHRVLHFVHRRPGLKIAELLDILKITKQSLNRVLKDLIETGFIQAQAGAKDRRERRLYVSAKGDALAMQLAHEQMKRFERAFALTGPQARGNAMAFLRAMALGTSDIDAQPQERPVLWSD